MADVELQSAHLSSSDPGRDGAVVERVLQDCEP